MDFYHMKSLAASCTTVVMFINFSMLLLAKYDWISNEFHWNQYKTIVRKL